MTSRYTFLILLIFFCCAGDQAIAQEAAAPAPKTIKGRILGEDGQPLASAPVFLIPIARDTQPGSGRFGFGQGQILSDEEGNFSFEHLAPGSYAIAASIPGFITLPPDQESGAGIYHPGDTINLMMVKGGVVTGKVTNAKGEPLTGAPVSAIRAGGLDGEEDSFSLPGGFGRTWRTDDLGVYRIYGLAPGSYVIQAGGRNPNGPNLPSQFDDDAPTFYPSTPRATAVPIVVRQGEEIIGIDVRLRGEKGRVLGGKVIAKSTTDANRLTGIQVSLYTADSDTPIATTFQRNTSPQAGFAFSGIADGDYEVVARLSNSLGSESDFASAPRRVSVRGADVSGLELPLLPLAVISGRVSIEPNPSCPKPSKSVVQEILLQAEPEQDTPRKISPRSRHSAAPNKNGEFTIRNLGPGRYHLTQVLPDENWYVREIQLDPPAAATLRKTPAPAPINIARSGLTLKSGDKLSGLRISIANGAALIKGKATAEKSVIYLLPAEKEAAEDLLRYRQTAAGNGGSFQFQHLAPGRYYLFSKSAPLERNRLTNVTYRNALRAEATSAGVSLELGPCQRINDYQLNAK